MSHPRPRGRPNDPPQSAHPPSLSGPHPRDRLPNQLNYDSNSSHLRNQPQPPRDDYHQQRAHNRDQRERDRRYDSYSKSTLKPNSQHNFDHPPSRSGPPSRSSASSHPTSEHSQFPQQRFDRPDSYDSYDQRSSNYRDDQEQCNFGPLCNATAKESSPFDPSNVRFIRDTISPLPLWFVSTLSVTSQQQLGNNLIQSQLTQLLQSDSNALPLQNSKQISHAQDYQIDIHSVDLNSTNPDPTISNHFTLFNESHRGEILQSSSSPYTTLYPQQRQSTTPLGYSVVPPLPTPPLTLQTTSQFNHPIPNFAHQVLKQNQTSKSSSIVPHEQIRSATAVASTQQSLPQTKPVPFFVDPMKNSQLLSQSLPPMQPKPSTIVPLQKKKLNKHLLPPQQGQLSLLLHTRGSGSVGKGKHYGTFYSEQMITNPATPENGANDHESSPHSSSHSTTVTSNSQKHQFSPQSPVSGAKSFLLGTISEFQTTSATTTSSLSTTDINCSKGNDNMAVITSNLPHNDMQDTLTTPSTIHTLDTTLDTTTVSFSISTPSQHYNTPHVSNTPPVTPSTMSKLDNYIAEFTKKLSLEYKNSFFHSHIGGGAYGSVFRCYLPSYMLPTTFSKEKYSQLNQINPSNIQASTNQTIAPWLSNSSSGALKLLKPNPTSLITPSVLREINAPTSDSTLFPIQVALELPLCLTASVKEYNGANIPLQRQTIQFQDHFQQDLHQIHHHFGPHNNNVPQFNINSDQKSSSKTDDIDIDDHILNQFNMKKKIHVLTPSIAVHDLPINIVSTSSIYASLQLLAQKHHQHHHKNNDNFITSTPSSTPTQFLPSTTTVSKIMQPRTVLQSSIQNVPQKYYFDHIARQFYPLVQYNPSDTAQYYHYSDNNIASSQLQPLLSTASPSASIENFLSNPPFPLHKQHFQQQYHYTWYFPLDIWWELTSGFVNHLSTQNYLQNDHIALSLRTDATSLQTKTSEQQHQKLTSVLRFWSFYTKIAQIQQISPYPVPLTGYSTILVFPYYPIDLHHIIPLSAAFTQTTQPSIFNHAKDALHKYIHDMYKKTLKTNEHKNATPLQFEAVPKKSFFSYGGLASPHHFHPEKRSQITPINSTLLEMFKNTPFSPLFTQQNTAKMDHFTRKAMIFYIFQQLLFSLANVHSRGFIHRDIKPANVLLTSDWHVVLGDYGLSRLSTTSQSSSSPISTNFAARSQVAPNFIHRAGKSTLRSISTNPIQRSEVVSRLGHMHNQGGMSPRMCTLFYRPPELLLGSTNYTKNVDVWSAGCLLSEMLLGYVPFAFSVQANQFSRLYPNGYDSSIDLDHNNQFQSQSKDFFKHIHNLILEYKINPVDMDKKGVIIEKTKFAQIPHPIGINLGGGNTLDFFTHQRIQASLPNDHKNNTTTWNELKSNIGGDHINAIPNFLQLDSFTTLDDTLHLLPQAQQHLQHQHQVDQNRKNVDFYHKYRAKDEFDLLLNITNVRGEAITSHLGQKILQNYYNSYNTMQNTQSTTSNYLELSKSGPILSSFSCNPAQYPLLQGGLPPDDQKDAKKTPSIISNPLVSSSDQQTITSTLSQVSGISHNNLNRLFGHTTPLKLQTPLFLSPPVLKPSFVPRNEAIDITQPLPIDINFSSNLDSMSMSDGSTTTTTATTPATFFIQPPFLTKPILNNVEHQLDTFIIYVNTQINAIEQSSTLDRQSDFLGQRFQPLFNHSNRYQMNSKNNFTTSNTPPMFNGSNKSLSPFDLSTSETTSSSFSHLLSPTHNNNTMVYHQNDANNIICSNRQTAMLQQTDATLTPHIEQSYLSTVLNATEYDQSIISSSTNNLPDWRLERLFTILPESTNKHQFGSKPSEKTALLIQKLQQRSQSTPQSPPTQVRLPSSTSNDVTIPTIPFLSTFLYHLLYLEQWMVLNNENSNSNSNANFCYSTTINAKTPSNHSQVNYDQEKGYLHLILYKIYYVFDIITKREINRPQYDLLSWTLAYNAHQRPSSLQALLHPSLMNSNALFYQQLWDYNIGAIPPADSRQDNI